MELPDNQPTSTKQPSNQSGLKGPKSTPLNLRKVSHKIKKPPLAPPGRPPRSPIIRHYVSPKVIHTNPADFMTLVQRLTGPDPGPTTLPPPSGGSSSANNAICCTTENGFGPSSLLQGPAGPMPPLPQMLVSPISDPSTFGDICNQPNTDYFCGLDSDQQLQNGDYFDGGCGGSDGAFLSPNYPIFSPSSAEFLSNVTGSVTPSEIRYFFNGMG